MSEGSGPLVFVKLPKTGSTTLRRILERQYPGAFRNVGSVFHRFDETAQRLRDVDPATVGALAGHITLGMEPDFPPGARVLTILREPVERTLSHYHFLVRPVEGEPRRGSGVGLLPAGTPRPAPDASLEECLGDGGVIPDNLQTRMLCGISSPHDELPVDALARAKANLRERVAFVGTMERFDEFVALLTIRLGWRTLRYEPERVNPGRGGRADLDERALRLVEERNALDLELHRYAGELLEEALREGGAEVELETEVIHRLRGGAPPADSDGLRGRLVDARVELAIRESELEEARAHVTRLERALAESDRLAAKLERRLAGTLVGRVRRRVRAAASRGRR